MASLKLTKLEVKKFTFYNTIAKLSKKTMNYNAAKISYLYYLCAVLQSISLKYESKFKEIFEMYQLGLF